MALATAAAARFTGRGAADRSAAALVTAAAMTMALVTAALGGATTARLAATARLTSTTLFTAAAGLTTTARLTGTTGFATTAAIAAAVVAAQQAEKRVRVSGAAEHQRDAQTERRQQEMSVHREAPRIRGRGNTHSSVSRLPAGEAHICVSRHHQSKQTMARIVTLGTSLVPIVPAVSPALPRVKNSPTKRLPVDR